MIYRARRDADGSAVYLKFLPDGKAGADKRARLRREQQMTSACASPRVIGAHDLIEHAGRIAIVVEDFGGVDLNISRPWERGLIDRLRVAIGAAAAVEAVHDRNVMHKDVTPANLVWNEETGEVKIIDFGISTTLKREAPAVVNPEVLEGTLAYLSPEQTGRMNRALDYRTDLYSLGATLYQIFTGTLPFDSVDPMELVHCHLARVPEPMHVRAPELPEVLWHIVGKLMAKNAEDRYQSATPLRLDLEACLAELEQTGAVKPFPIARGAATERFTIPQRLYGRDDEIGQVLGHFGHAAEGAAKLILVAGYSGIGKSALVHEVHKPIVEKRGYFIAGKFDQFQRNVPYASLIEAFAELVAQLLTESDARLENWRSKILEAVGVKGQVILDVIPNVALIIGEQPPVPELAPTEAQNRFNSVFADFVRTFCSESHPLTIFLDDLQWADGPSLRLIERFMSDVATHHLLLIGAYRDNEVDPAHPLMLTVEAIREAGNPPATIQLAPLDEPSIRQLLADTLLRAPEDVDALVGLCASKTGGNPFFLTRFLTTIYEEGGFRIDRSTSQWSWDLDAIEAMGITDNVVELVTRKIRTLPEETQRLLELAACIGASFDLHSIAIAHEHTVAQTADLLWPALAEGLLLPLGGEYKFLQDEDHQLGGSPTQIRYRWLHDRVQQAAYGLIDEARLPAMHGRVGRLLLDNLSEEERSDRLFEIVGHLNSGRSLLDTTEARRELAELNVQVGRRAISSAAYRPALGFLNQAIELLGDDAWQQAYDLALSAHTETANAAHLCHEWRRMDDHIDVVLANARTVLDKVRAYDIRVMAAMAQVKLQDGIRHALEILALLGIDMPEEPTDEDIGAYFELAAKAIGDRDVEDLVHVPTNPTPEGVATLRILQRVISVAYIGAPRLFPLPVLKAVAISATDGDSDASSFAYAAYGILACGVLEDFVLGEKLSRLSDKVIEKYDDKAFAGRSVYVGHCFIHFWNGHARFGWAGHRDAYRMCLEAGDHEFAGWALMKRTHQGFFMGLPLQERIVEARNYVDTLLALEQLPPASGAQCTLQAMLCLTGDSDDTCELVGPDYDEHQAMPRYIEGLENFALCHLFVTKAMLYSVFGRWSDTVAQVESIAPYQHGMVGLVHIPVFYFYVTMGRLALAGQADDEQRDALIAESQPHIDKLRAWAEHCPENFQHRYLLMEAAKAHAQSDFSEAEVLYIQGCEAAERQGYLQDAALGAERLWFVRMLLGDLSGAQEGLHQARDLYARWGATAKVRQLEGEHPELLDAETPPTGETVGITTGTHRWSTTITGVISKELDLETLLKANHAISSEMQMDGLSRKLLEISLENAGARRGVLLIVEDDEIAVEAETHVDGGTTTLDGVALNDYERIPHNIINFVRHTTEAVVLDDATASTRFGRDPWIVNSAPRSVLCLPMQRQGQTNAFIYLENELAPCVFTAKRVQLIRMLLAQAAISIQNARLFAGLKSVTAAQQRFLPADFVRALGQSDIAAVRRGDFVSKRMSTLVCGLDGFAPLTDSIGDAATIEYLTGHFEEVEKPVIEARGFIHRIAADELTALFGGTAADAVRAGIGVCKSAREGGAQVEPRCGVEIGTVLLGAVGPRDRIMANVVGRSVTRASQLQRLAERYGAAMLIGDETNAALAGRDDLSLRPVDRLLFGADDVTTYEVLDAESADRRTAKESGRDALSAAFDAYIAGRFSEAANGFDAAAAAAPGDAVPVILGDRARAFAERPPEDWRGAMPAS